MQVVRIAALAGLCLGSLDRSAMSVDFSRAGPVALDPVSVKHGEERSEVGIWGRTYRFAKGPLRAAITTAGQEILDAPMRLVGSVDGQPIEWQRSGLQVLRQSPGQATICGWQANASLILDAGVRVEVQ